MQIRLFLLLPLLLLAACSSRLEPRPQPSDLRAIAAPMAVNINWARELSASMLENNSEEQLALLAGDFVMTDGKSSLIRVNGKSGSIGWETEVGGVVAGAMLVEGGYIYAVTDNAVFYKLNQSSGKVIWQVRVPSESLVKPVLSKGILIVQTDDGKISAYREQSGEQIWSYSRARPRLSLRGSAQPVVERDMVIAGLASGKIVALSIFDGKLVWESVVTLPRGRSNLERMVDVDGQMLVYRGVLYASAYQGRVVALSVESGRLIWARELSSAKGLLFSADHNRIFLTDVQGNIWAFARDTGATVWRQDALKDKVVTRPAVHGDFLILGDRDDNLFWVRQSDGVVAGHLHYFEMMESSGLWATVDVISDGVEALDEYPQPRGIASISEQNGAALIAYRNGIVSSVSLAP